MIDGGIFNANGFVVVLRDPLGDDGTIIVRYHLEFCCSGSENVIKFVFTFVQGEQVRRRKTRFFVRRV